MSVTITTGAGKQVQVAHAGLDPQRAFEVLSDMRFDGLEQCERHGHLLYFFGLHTAKDGAASVGRYVAYKTDAHTYNRAAAHLSAQTAE